MVTSQKVGGNISMGFSGAVLIHIGESLRRYPNFLRTYQASVERTEKRKEKKGSSLLAPN
jgi:hypothetical protein